MSYIQQWYSHPQQSKWQNAESDHHWGGSLTSHMRSKHTPFTLSVIAVVTFRKCLGHPLLCQEEMKHGKILHRLRILSFLV